MEDLPFQGVRNLHWHADAAAVVEHGEGVARVRGSVEVQAYADDIIGYPPRCALTLPRVRAPHGPSVIHPDGELIGPADQRTALHSEAEADRLPLAHLVRSNH